MKYYEPTEEDIEVIRQEAIKFITERQEDIDKAIKAGNTRMTALCRFRGCLYCDADDTVEEQIENYIKSELNMREQAAKMNRTLTVMKQFFSSLSDDDKELVRENVFVEKDKLWLPDMDVDSWKEV